VLTPLAVDPGHPFPYISNLSLSIAVQVHDPATGVTRLARIKVPKSLPRWVPFGKDNHFVPLEQVIGAHLDALFPGMEIRGFSTFRVTRYADLELTDMDEDDDLLAGDRGAGFSAPLRRSRPRRSRQRHPSGPSRFDSRRSARGSAAGNAEPDGIGSCRDRTITGSR